MPKQQYKNLTNITRSNYTPIADFLKSRDFRNNRLWKLVKGKLFTFVDGKKLSRKEFDEKYPLINPISFQFAPENADKTKLFMH